MGSTFGGGCTFGGGGICDTNCAAAAVGVVIEQPKPVGGNTGSGAPVNGVDTWCTLAAAETVEEQLNQ